MSAARHPQRVADDLAERAGLSTAEREDVREELFVALPGIGLEATPEPAHGPDPAPDPMGWISEGGS